MNLRREFTKDPFSGSKRIRVSDPGFLKKNATGVSLSTEDGKVQMVKHRCKRSKTSKNQKGWYKNTHTKETVEGKKAKNGNKHVGKSLNNLNSVNAKNTRAAKN